MKGPSDWKSRLAEYESVLKTLRSSEGKDYNVPENKLIEYISDVNSNCQLAGLQICEEVFKLSKEHQYSTITKCLLTKNFSSRPQNGVKATELIKTCFIESRESVLQVLFEETNSKNQKVITAVLSVFAYFANQITAKEREDMFKYITPLTEHRAQSIRKDANALINTLNEVKDLEPEIVEKPTLSTKTPHATKNFSKVEPIRSSSKQQPEVIRQKSPEVRKSKKKIIAGGCYSAWSTWVPEETKNNLSSHKWQDVTSGLDELRNLFEQDTSNSNIAAFGILTVFLSRTFPPKVMNQLTQNILYYIKYDPDTVSEDTINAGIKFFIDKITDKRMEKDLFELGDILCSHISTSSFFQALYPSFSAKNPSLLARIVAYCTHTIRKYQKNTKIAPLEFCTQLNPLLSNADPNTRKATNECIASLALIYGESIINEFTNIKKVQIDEIMKMMKNLPITEANDFNSYNTVEKKKFLPQNNSIPVKTEKSSPPQTKRKLNKEEPMLLPHKKEFVRNSSSRATRPKRELKPDFGTIDNDIETEKTKSLIPLSLIQMLKSSTDKTVVIDIINQINDILLNRHEETHYSDLEQCISVITPYLSYDDVNILYVIAQFMQNTIYLIKSEISNAPVSVLSMLFNTMNYNNRKLRKIAEDMLYSLYENDKRFVEEIFVIAFNDLTPEGKNASLKMLMSLNCSFEPKYFTQIVADLISDQQNIENSEIFINKFIEFGGRELLKQRAKKMIPAKKALIMRALHEESESIFIDGSVTSKRRTNPVDLVAATIAFNTYDFSTIEKEVNNQWRSVFNLRLKHQTKETFKVDSSAVLSQIKKDSVNVLHFTDLILLWCIINYKLDIVDFISSFIDECTKAHFSFYEIHTCICIPLLLEVSESMLNSIYNLTSQDIFISSLQLVCESSSNVLHLTKIFDFVTSLSLPNESKEFFIDRSQILLNSIKDQQLVNAINKFYGGKPVVCEMSEELSEKMDSSLLHVYEWIYQLSSTDVTLSVQALKSVSKQLDVDASIFNNHLDALVLAIIAKIHIFFATEPPPVRLYKYIAFCIFSLLDKTDLPKVISYSSVKQIVFEILTRLCNGLGNDQASSQSLNLILVKLMETCTSFTFKSLINAVSQFIDQKYPDVWVKYALKCFDACVDHVLTNDKKEQSDFEEDIITGLIECENLIRSKGVEPFKNSIIGTKVLNSIKQFARAVYNQYPEIIQRSDVINILGNKIRILSL